MKLIIICQFERTIRSPVEMQRRNTITDVIGLSCRREWCFDSQCQDYKSQGTRYSCFDNDIGELITSRQPVSRFTFAATVLEPFTIHVPLSTNFSTVFCYASSTFMYLIYDKFNKPFNFELKKYTVGRIYLKIRIER